MQALLYLLTASSDQSGLHRWSLPLLERKSAGQRSSLRLVVAFSSSFAGKVHRQCQIGFTTRPQ
eukprot:3095086-Rhodomonas_salina.3